MNTKPKEYRCTRSALYGPDTDGFMDPRSREGHYIISISETDARKEMRRRFYEVDSAIPLRLLFGREMYTVEVWKEDLPEWVQPC